MQTDGKCVEMAIKSGRSKWGQAEPLTGLIKQMPSVEVGEEVGLAGRTAEAQACWSLCILRQSLSM